VAGVLDDLQFGRGQSWASSQAVRNGPDKSRRPWINTPGMPLRRCASRSN
jgi:hypothetical protein